MTPDRADVPLPYLSRPARWARLANGHQVIAIPTDGEVAHLHTLVRTGSVNETDANSGVSHFLEHLLFKGTLQHPVGEFDRLVEAMGGAPNAGTSRDYTVFHITLPVAGYADALALHADMLLHAALPEAEIGPPFDPASPPADRHERSVVLEEIRMGQDSPWRRALARLQELLYPTHPYRREVIGTPEVIAGIPRDDIVAYYRTWYQPAYMTTLVASPLDPDKIIADVAEAFGSSSTGVPPVSVRGKIGTGTILYRSTKECPSQMSTLHHERHKMVPVPIFFRPCHEHMIMPLNVAYCVVGFLGPPAAELRETVALDVLTVILGDGLSSRLHRRLVEELPDTPFAAAGAEHWTMRDSSTVLAYGIARPDAAARAFDLLSAEATRIITDPPTSAELEKAVTRLEATFAVGAETAAGYCGALADSLARRNDLCAVTDYLPLLHALTPDDLAAAAATYLAPERLCGVTVGPEIMTS